LRHAQLAEFVHDVIDALEVGLGIAAVEGAQLVADVEIGICTVYVIAVFIGLDRVVDETAESDGCGDAKLYRGSGSHYHQHSLLAVLLVHYLAPQKE
jgi:hypothetical protein